MEIQKIELDYANIEYAIKVLSPYGEKKGLLEGPITLSEEELTKKAKNYDFNKVVKECNEIEDTVSKAKNELNFLKNERDTYTPWKNLPVNLENVKGTTRVKTAIGTLKVAAYDEAKIEALLANPGIVRNRQKVRSAVKNAAAFLQIQGEFGSFDRYIWGFVDGRAIQNSWPDMASIPAKTPLSEVISKDLKKRGFSFVGPTIIYAYMQAAGLVNDHVVGCFRHREVAALGSAGPV